MSTRSPAFKPIAALLCDELRTEDNGKYIVIGGYDSKMVVKRTPFKGKIAIQIVCVDMSTGTAKIEVELRYPG